jgi:hypothetical protein
MTSSDIGVRIGKALDEKNWKLAEALALEAIKKDDNDYASQIYLCIARLAMAGRAEQEFYFSMLSDIDKAESLLKKNPLDANVDARYMSEIEFVRGSCYLALSDWDRSKEEEGFNHLRKALEFYPEHPLALEILTESGQLKHSHAQSEKKSGCFIATVAYGSAFSPEVIALQELRDSVLLKSRFGQMFVALYYLFSPSLAQHLEGKALINRILRMMFLDPVVRCYAFYNSRITKDG